MPVLASAYAVVEEDEDWVHGGGGERALTIYCYLRASTRTSSSSSSSSYHHYYYSYYTYSTSCFTSFS
ncbi:hypothetical protein TcWFU_002757 [Taenia crassiceps]|uniref:Uncharacterized protein n=1 Tax=Taenia crassiceps TaxID=6207 RepID=A0ABR4QPQ6_9CEST